MTTSEQRLTLVKKQKQATKMNVNKEIAKAEQILSTEAGINRENAEVTMKKLEGYRDKLQNYDNEILITLEDDIQDNEVTKSIEFDDLIVEAVEKLSARLRLELSFNTTAEHNASNLLSNADKHRVKLPKLEIPKYQGNPLKWQEFWDSYSNTIHNNDDLSSIDKFTYLKSYLGGDALRLADGYRLTAANYDSVIERLTERFGDPQLAIFSHFESMLALPTASHDLSQLQQVFDDCEKHIRSLVALGLPEDTFGQVFTPIVLSKLPKFVRMELHRKNGSAAWTLSKLRELLKDEIHARDMSQRSFGEALRNEYSNEEVKNISKKQDVRFSNSAKQHSHKTYRPSATSSSLVTSSGDKKSRCVYCKAEHYSDQCMKYSDVNSRRKLLTDRCLSCLLTGHRVRDCRTRRECCYCKKTGHHRSLCEAKFGARKTSSHGDVSMPVDGTNINAAEFKQNPNATGLLSHGEKTNLQTALTSVAGLKRTVSARLLLDTGCSRSFVTSSLCDKIGARFKGEESVTIAGFSDKRRKTLTYKIYEIDVIQRNGHKITITANATEVITCPVMKYPIDVKKHPFITQIPLAEPLLEEAQTLDVDILIGGDYYYEFVGVERIRCSDGLILLSSSLGYIAAGRIESDQSGSKDRSATTMLLTRSDPMPDSNFNLERFWRLEDIGVRDQCETQDDEVALNHFNSTVQFQDGRYEVQWPWKMNCPQLSDNYQLCRGRLNSLFKRIQTTPEVLEQYDRTIRDQIEKDIVEKAPEKPDGHAIYYIPHHCVITPQKTTTKLRIVYDASCKSGKSNCSLNDCIYRGPVILADLCGLLLRFRVCRIAMVSDIEKAFLQVVLQKCDRDVTRFLWVKDIKAPITCNNLVTYRFRRVPFGVNASPFLLAATIAHHLNSNDTSTAKSISKNVYVDNVLGGVESVELAIEYYTEAKKIFESASMNLREWYCNDVKFVETINQSDRGNGTSTKVLGLQWNTETDTISCSLPTFSAESVTTKRQFLQTCAGVFDPCGYFAPITINGKIMMQKLWEEKYGWDDALPPQLLDNARKVLKSFQEIPQTRIPRQYDATSIPDSRLELHCFCDASAKAYSAVIYLRSVSGSTTLSSIVFSKCRVAPLKKLSIPKLELMAVVVGVRILSFVEKELSLPVHHKWLWSDSQCVLHWIKGKEVTSLFVWNRVREIKEHTNVSMRYVPTKENPADLPSRGISTSRLSEEKIWWNGPTWLRQSEDYWPATFPPIDNKQENAAEANSLMVLNSPKPESLTGLERYSSFTKMVRTTAWILRFFNRSRKVSNETGNLTCHEIAAATSRLLMEAQKQSFPECTSMKTRPNFAKQLDVFVDPDGFLRCRGRYTNAELSNDAKFPLLLPKASHPFSRLLILDYHRRLAHAGVKHVMSQLRFRYWIPNARNEIKKTLRDCYICRRVTGGPYRVPVEPDLPNCRIRPRPPFSSVGLDYLGPLQIRAVNGELQKVWICLFTCTVVRAIHLELVDNMSTSQFLLCFRRFMAIYGKPELVICDNAKQFHAGRRKLDYMWRQICESDQVKDFVATDGIRWKFVTEFSPWMGGFYERMVGIVKCALKKALDQRLTHLSELQTVVAEIASVVNTRPLVYQGTDVSDNDPLTPAHFLLRSRSTFPELPREDSEFVSVPTSDDLICQWQQLQDCVSRFWRLWRSDYLLSLREQWRKLKQRSVVDVIPTVGTSVLIKDNLPRAQWRLGLITELVPSADKLCRSVKLRLANGRTVYRPIKLLYPIEMVANSSVSKMANDTDISTNRDSVTAVMNRPQSRKAANVARAKIKKITDEELNDSL